MSDKPLRLRACDAEDLKALSAVVQDALVPVHDMRWLPEERSFVMAMNRFRWEHHADGAGHYERTHCGLRFANVEGVQLRGFDQTEIDYIMSLLTVTYEASLITLHFAGHRDVRLQSAALDCHLDDFGEPWPTMARPMHSEA